MYPMKTMTPAQKLEASLNQALYAAAKKAGMVNDLYRAQVEVIVVCYLGKVTHAYISWEHELTEDETFVVPEAAIARAEKWLASYTSKNPLTLSV